MMLEEKDGEEQETEDIVTENYTHSDIPVDAAGSDSSHIKEKNRAKLRKGVLGQPVRRENPNRKDIPADKEAKEQNEPLKSTQTETAEGETASASAPKNSWADALQKAMQAISQDK